MTKIKDIPSRIFVIKNNEYHVFKKEGNTIIKLNGKVVFDNNKLKVKYFEWVKSINN